MTETQKRFREEMAQLKREGKLQQRPRRKTVYFTSGISISVVIFLVYQLFAVSNIMIPGGLLNLTKHIATQEIRSAVDQIDSINQDQAILMKEIIAKLQTNSDLESIDQFRYEGILHQLKEKAWSIEGYESLKRVEIERLEQIQSIITAWEMLELSSERNSIINEAINQYNLFGLQVTDEIGALLTEEDIKWERTSEGGIRYEYTTTKIMP